MPPPELPAPRVSDFLRDLVTRPREYLLRRWHWKAALCSACIRFAIFFAANASAGWKAAWGAALAEFLYRLAASGCYGSITQAFRQAQPFWLANLTAAVLVPLFQHLFEFLIHWLRGTPNLKASILISAAFTIFSTLFNLYSMRRGSLVVGAGAKTFWEDILAFPRLLVGFLSSPFTVSASR